jgi:hypothetical protein
VATVWVGYEVATATGAEISTQLITPGETVTTN